MDEEGYAKVVFLIGVPGYPGYFASKEGDIYSNLRGELVKRIPVHHPTGYLSLQVVKDAKKVMCKVHRMVAYTYLSNPHNYEVVNHKDGIKDNNNVENLEWASYSQNTKHAHDNNLVKKTHHKAVVQLDKSFHLIQEYSSVTNAANSMGVYISQISGVCNGTKRSCKGYTWMYKEDYVAGKKPRGHKYNKPVSQYTLDGKYIRTYESLTEAAKENNLIATNIAAACTGLQKTSGGYTWKFEAKIEEPNNQDKVEKEISEWKTIKEFPKYKISPEGRIYSYVTKKFLKLTPIDGFRVYVALCNIQNKRKNMMLHRLVALAYLPNPHNYPVVNHKDGDYHNNHVSNLEWCTYSYNAIHAYETDLNTNKVGVLQMSGDNIIGTYDSIAKAARNIGVNPSSIQHAMRYDTVCRGYKWKRA